MNLFKNIPDNTANRISYWHLAAFLFFLPTDRYLSQLALISFGVHTIIHLERKSIRSLVTAENGILASVWLLTLSGLLYTHDLHQGEKDLVIQAGLLVFPFVFSLTSLNLARYRNRLLLFFAFCCTACVLYLFGDALLIIYYYGFPLKSLFSYSFINQNFSSPLAMHATYLSAFLALSISILLNAWLHAFKQKNRWLYLVCILILCAGLIQLASRAVWVALIIFQLTAFPFMAFEGKKRIKYFLVSFCITAFAVFLIAGTQVFRERYIAEFRADLKKEPINQQIPEPRMARWEAAFELIRVSPITGYGSGSEKRLLKEKYYEKQLYTSYLLELNTHNQYLALWLKHGIAGLLVFLFTLGWGYYRAWRQKDIIFICFMLLVTVMSFSENIIDVNKGVFFYGFFFALLVKSGKPLLKIYRSDKNAEIV